MNIDKKQKREILLWVVIIVGGFLAFFWFNEQFALKYFEASRKETPNDSGGFIIPRQKLEVEQGAPNEAEGAVDVVYEKASVPFRLTVDKMVSIYSLPGEGNITSEPIEPLTVVEALGECVVGKEKQRWINVRVKKPGGAATGFIPAADTLPYTDAVRSAALYPVNVAEGTVDRSGRRVEQGDYRIIKADGEELFISDGTARRTVSRADIVYPETGQ